MSERAAKIIAWLNSTTETPWTSAKTALAIQVIDAFADVRLDDETGHGIGLYEADCNDDYLAADSEEYQYWRAQDEREHWENVLFLMENRLRGKSFRHMTRFSPFSAFTFMDGKGRRFALPYYLLWALQGSRSQRIQYDLAQDYCTQDLPLNSAQREAILAVARHLRDHADNDDDRADWQAVITHWQH